MLNFIFVYFLGQLLTIVLHNIFDVLLCIRPCQVILEFSGDNFTPLLHVFFDDPVLRLKFNKFLVWIDFDVSNLSLIFFGNIVNTLLKFEVLFFVLFIKYSKLVSNGESLCAALFLQACNERSQTENTFLKVLDGSD